MHTKIYNNLPKVSIIVSVYNGADTIELCLRSIAAQTYTNYEVICVDDGSTDSSREILDACKTIFQNNTYIVIKNKENKGLTKSLNIGIKSANGEYIARIDCDDSWTSTKLQKQVEFLDQNSEYGVVGSFYINAYKGKQYMVRLPITDKSIKKHIYQINPFGHSCILVRKKTLQNVNLYDENIVYGQDLDLWLRLMPHTKFHNINEFLCTRRADQGLSISHSRQQMTQTIKTIIRYIKKYNAPVSYYAYLVRPIIIILLPQPSKKIFYNMMYEQNK